MVPLTVLRLTPTGWAWRSPARAGPGRSVGRSNKSWPSGGRLAVDRALDIGAGEGLGVLVAEARPVVPAPDAVEVTVKDEAEP